MNSLLLAAVLFTVVCLLASLAYFRVRSTTAPDRLFLLRHLDYVAAAPWVLPLAVTVAALFVAAAAVWLVSVCIDTTERLLLRAAR